MRAPLHLAHINVEELGTSVGSVGLHSLWSARPSPSFFYKQVFLILVFHIIYFYGSSYSSWPCSMFPPKKGLDEFNNLYGSFKMLAYS